MILFNKYLLNADSAPSTVLGIGETHNKKKGSVKLFLTGRPHNFSSFTFLFLCTPLIDKNQVVSACHLAGFLLLGFSLCSRVRDHSLEIYGAMGAGR